MLLYRINEKGRTVSIVWSINKNELLSASEKEKVYTFERYCLSLKISATTAVRYLKISVLL